MQASRPFPKKAADKRRRGASALETVLLLAAVGIPLMVFVFVGVRILLAHYGMVSTLNALPIP